jgi:23S rRNA pseudouridine1911/1915/1917 synthase
MNLSVSPNPRVRFAIRYEDEELLVIEKPTGLVTQPGKGHEEDTLLNGLFALHAPALQNLGQARDFGLLHRLDKQASGLLIVALRARAYDTLRDDFANRRIRKLYWAIAHRAPAKPSGVINRPILETTGDQRLARISRAGKPSITAYRTLAVGSVGGGAALLECRPITGRLHQVRVHLASIGCELVGDGMYAKDAIARAAPRVALHSHRVVFEHPTSGETIDVRSRWPKDLDGVLKKFGLTKPTLATPSGIAHQHEESADADTPDG